MREQISESNILILDAETVESKANLFPHFSVVGAAFAFWSLPVVFKFIQFYFEHLVLNVPINFVYWLCFILPDWYFWAFVTILVFRLGEKFPLESRKSIRRLLFIHVPLGLFISFAHYLMIVFIQYYWKGDRISLSRLLVIWSNNISVYFLFYSGILAVLLVFQYKRHFRETELKEANLKNELSQAQLRALQMQLHPHFLFNTLNSISALMFKDAKAANSMLARLSDLLRISLSQEAMQEVTLEDELDFLRTYLGIEQIRFQDRLVIEFKIEPETLEALVPSLILQPLVENSIKHGVARRRGQSFIEISSRKVYGNLHLKVRDKATGTNKKAELIIKEGVGLSNTRNRLQKLYEGNHSFELSVSPDGGGAEAVIIIPFRTDNDE
jgi:two-component system, LytTR family, sensor kinase